VNAFSHTGSQGWTEIGANLKTVGTARRLARRRACASDLIAYPLAPLALSAAAPALAIARPTAARVGWDEAAGGKGEGLFVGSEEEVEMDRGTDLSILSDSAMSPGLVQDAAGGEEGGREEAGWGIDVENAVRQALLANPENALRLKPEIVGKDGSQDGRILVQSQMAGEACSRDEACQGSAKDGKRGIEISVQEAILLSLRDASGVSKEGSSGSRRSPTILLARGLHDCSHLLNVSAPLHLVAETVRVPCVSVTAVPYPVTQTLVSLYHVARARLSRSPRPSSHTRISCVRQRPIYSDSTRMSMKQGAKP
jgi:hypothetical protein